MSHFERNNKRRGAISFENKTIFLVSKQGDMYAFSSEEKAKNFIELFPDQKNISITEIPFDPKKLF